MAANSGTFRKGDGRPRKPKGTKNRPNERIVAAMNIYEDLIGSVFHGRNSFYVYAHYFNGQCFYVGKGAGRRAWQRKDGCRNDLWAEYVSLINGSGKDYEVRIVAAALTEKEALAVEAALISARRPECNILTLFTKDLSLQ